MMPHIVIPEEKFEEFLRSLLVRVTKTQEELVAEMRADVEASEALFHARLEEALARRTRAHEEELERRARAFEDKLVAAEDEVARLLERLRHMVEAEDGELIVVMRIVGPNFIVRLRVQDDVVVEAARPISYMKGWKLERVFALCRRWDWKIEFSDAELAQQARAQARPA